MRPIEKGTLVRLRAKLEEARDAEYQAVLNVANAGLPGLEARLNQLRDWRRITSELQECINRLERDGLVSTETAEAEVYASKEPQKVWEDGTPVVFPGGPLGDW